jgi:hypothetical protein
VGRSLFAGSACIGCMYRLTGTCQIAGELGGCQWHGHQGGLSHAVQQRACLQLTAAGSCVLQKLETTVRGEVQWRCEQPVSHGAAAACSCPCRQLAGALQVPTAEGSRGGCIILRYINVM